MSRKSTYQWHQLWRDGGIEPWSRAGRADHGAVCRRAAWRSSPRIWRRDRPCTTGWRTRRGPLRGWPR
ncbi:hypothetical protein ACFYR1_27650 [Streptomyces canus]|uniref:hypothetical protein n=1 Tax=Streptomyces canus TaxID=58343 RepID=UPI003689AD99